MFLRTFRTPERYRIEAGSHRSELWPAHVPRKKTRRSHGALQATLDLERCAAFLAPACGSRRRPCPQKTARSKSPEIWTISPIPAGRPELAGDLDMRLLDPITGYPDAPEGMAHLDLAAAGQAAHSTSTVPCTLTEAPTSARASRLRASLSTRASTPIQKQLLITQIVARLRQGGQIEGTVALEPWLPHLCGMPAANRCYRSRSTPARPQCAGPAPSPRSFPSTAKSLPISTMLLSTRSSIWSARHSSGAWALTLA